MATTVYNVTLWTKRTDILIQITTTPSCYQHISSCKVEIKTSTVN